MPRRAPWGQAKHPVVEPQWLRSYDVAVVVAGAGGVGVAVGEVLEIAVMMMMMLMMMWALLAHTSLSLV
ncbi:hypothetical protein N9L68_04950 [bacterium]|nr:hypothetical protein [bacterium]